MFLFPPHPHSKMRIRPDSVAKLEEDGGWLAQRKYNGWHAVISIFNGESQIWNRHGEAFTKYKLTPEMRKALAAIPGIDPKTEVVLDGEFIHGQAVSDITGVQSQRNTLALFDILYYGRPLLMMDFQERYELLTKLCGNPNEYEPKKRGLMVSEWGDEAGKHPEYLSQVWLAETFRDEFLYRFYEMYEFDKHGRDKFPDIEGLVCKRAKHSMLKAGNQEYDVTWMMRVRKTKENVYLF